MLGIPSYEAELARVIEAVKPKVGVLSDEPTIEDETVGAADAHLPPPVAPPPVRVTTKTLFSHPETHPIVLDLALLAKYPNAEWLEWEPESVQYHVNKDLGPLSDLNFSKIMAMKTLHLVDSFWEQWEVFTWVTMSLNNLFPDFQVMQVPSVAQSMISVFIANRVREDVPWSEELQHFLGAVHQNDGVFVAQPPLEDAIIQGRGVAVDIADVTKRWPDVRISGHAPTGTSAEDEQLRRMLAIRDLLAENVLRLRSQLPLVSHA